MKDDFKDAVPHSNLSAAHYEKGEYPQCVEDIETKYTLSGSADGQWSKKLAPRLIKAYLQLKNHEAAKKQLGLVKDHADYVLLTTLCDRGSRYRMLQQA